VETRVVVNSPGLPRHQGSLERRDLRSHSFERREAASSASAQIDTRDNHLAFAVTDHIPVKAALDALGTPYIERVNAGGIPQIFLHDPDGHTIEIGIYPPHPPFLEQ
jgi:catechol 2,3-dioxygenase-like lactoylglutathione lyase family enzyme